MEDARFHISLFGRLHCRLARDAVSERAVKAHKDGDRRRLASRRRRRTTDSHRNESARGSQRQRRRRWRRRGKRDEAIHSIDATASSGTMTTKTRRGGKKGGRKRGTTERNLSCPTSVDPPDRSSVHQASSTTIYRPFLSLAVVSAR